VGLFDRMKEPVRGTANVVSATTLDAGKTGKDECTMQLIVQADGLMPTSISHRDGDTPVDRWPDAGDVLPVTVDREKPERLRIEWDEVRVGGSTAGAAMAVPVTSPGVPAVAGEHHSIRDEHPEIPPEAAAIVDQLASMFPGASVNVAEPTVVKFDSSGQVLRGAEAAAAMAGVANAFGGDRISQLERLAKLHEEGALTDQEFEAEKRRVLGESGGSASGSDPSATSS
jgi:Short C-terminal domain